MNWDCGIIKKAYINGYSVDVGGYIHPWLEKYKITYRSITELALYKYNTLEDGRFYLEATLNGNYHYSFEYDAKNKDTSHFKSFERGWMHGDIILPHLPSHYEGILIKKTIGYFETYIKDKQTYPAPTFLGFIEFESDTLENKPFIFHNKAGSGYMGFDKEYGKLKLDFIKKILKI